MKKINTIHPFLFAIYPLLFLYSHNVQEVSMNEILLPLAAIIFSSFLLRTLLHLFIKDKDKAGLAFVLILLFFFSYGHIHNEIRNLHIGGLKIGRHSYHLIIWAILLTSSIFFLLKIRRNFKNVTQTLNIMSIFLIGIVVLEIGVYAIKRRALFQPQNEINEMSKAMPQDCGKAQCPDIYYIIFDRYANAQVLQDFLDFDNSELINYLKDKGFYVASDSRANYPSTFQSLASSLNLTHLTHLTNKIGEASDDKTHVYYMLQDFKAWRFLKAKGYKFIQIGSWWSGTRRNKFADLDFGYSYYNLSEFSEMLIETTMLNPFLASDDDSRIRNAQIHHVPFQFQKLTEIPKIPGKKFIFAHVLLPHKPFIFGPNGEVLTEQMVKIRNNKENYLNQLQYVNVNIKLIVDKILSESKNSPIIILQSDEGPCLPFEELRHCGGKTMNWKLASNEALNVHMKNLNAYYLPGVNQDVLYPGITPVNTFRLVFNLYFETHYDLLADESYVFEDGKHLYKFINVTDKLE